MNFSVLDLLDLSAREREVFLYVARNGPVPVDALAEATGHDTVGIHQLLESLGQQGRLRVGPDGMVDVVLGRISSRTTLPAQLWPALLASDRPYSRQEIATLRTALPILQLARARLSHFADHGPGHALRVKSFATQLSYVVGLSAAERHLLRAGALFHDLGNILDRDRHHIISQEMVHKMATDGEIPFGPDEAELIGLLCRWHRREYDPERTDRLDSERIRTGFLASILRVADAMDIDHRRSDYGDRFRRVLEQFYAEQMPYWTSLEEILGVRIRCTPDVILEVFTRGEVGDNIQVDMLRRDLAGTPLEWTIETIPVALAGDTSPESGRHTASSESGGRVLIVFPFDAHSIVMAALSQKHARAAGLRVELLCYPDTASGPAWLWRDVLRDISTAGIANLVVIGDRPNENVSLDMFHVVQRWQDAGARVTLLNRHEAQWTHLPKLLNLGVEAILGGDGTYFWGVPADITDLSWGRIAALCVRDPTMSTINPTAQEEAVTKGLLAKVYDGTAQGADHTAGWVALAEAIIDRIVADDRDYFADHMEYFSETYATPATAPTTEGRVVVFDDIPGPIPQAYYWFLEAAIEENGRRPVRGIQFSTPYAVATWPDGDCVELLAISHWREEEATPIRFLYPAGVGPPQGHEGTVRARLPADDADTVVRKLITACNQKQ